MNINELGARLVVAVIRKQIDARRAVATLIQHAQPCRAGAHGLCTTHGQALIECERKK